MLLGRNCLQQLCTQSCARRSERMGFLVLLRGARMGVPMRMQLVCLRACLLEKESSSRHGRCLLVS